METENQAQADKLFTVSQIAAALGVSRQAVDRTLRAVPPSGHRVVSAVLAKVWAFRSLPRAMQERLNAIAAQRGYESGERMFGVKGDRWESPRPLAEVEARFLEKAARLQRALLPSLERRNDMSLTAAEFSKRLM